MKVGVLGAGFGLYGYLPALLLCEQQVVMPERYRARLRARSDVAHLGDRVEWAEDERAVLAAVPTLVITRRPADQAGLAPLLSGTNLKRVLLEKPLAPDPRGARDVVAAIRRADLGLRVGYLFRYTPWADTVRQEACCGGREITLRWQFRAHHYLHDQVTWKRSVAAGGGALRFYGIHLIALLAEIGYREVKSSSCSARDPDQAETWEARFGGDRLADIRVEVDSNCDRTSFSIVTSDRAQPLLAQVNPFSAAGYYGANLDGRVDVLLQLCRDLVGSEGPAPSWYGATLDLWEAVEKANIFHVPR